MDAGSAVVLITLLLLSILWFLGWRTGRKRSQLPPGPAPWPILGNLWQKDVLPLYRTYQKLSSRYGPIFTVWLGLKPVVVLCGYEVVKDALVGHSEEFGGRPEIPLLVQLSKDYGFVSNNEKKWRELRRFTLSTLRDFGMGKSSMSQRVQQEAQHLVELLAELKVELHKLTLDPSCPRDYIDCFLMKAEKVEVVQSGEKNSSENMYSNEDLIMSVFNLFGAGTVTTSNSLVFCVLILAKYPHIQDGPTLAYER
ncbi:cytochrome p450 2c5-like [Limosa lapponica baueri]|uniref:Cytochrome p450 2c5-like n=1 Tax=Limosa lapponica baueri TaxID=1758121 RepID=A0A2I0T1P4_LIMLA|nr:cytochrome p450 2c5-like [Limosa lapponica baueri]